MMASPPAGAPAPEPAPEFDFVLFGATGDLARRKLLPALFDAHAAGSLHPRGRILALGSQPLSHDAYLPEDVGELAHAAQALHRRHLGPGSLQCPAVARRHGLA